MKRALAVLLGVFVVVSIGAIMAVVASRTLTIPVRHEPEPEAEMPAPELPIATE